MTVTRINDFTAAVGKAKELQRFLANVTGTIKAAPGCQGCTLYLDPEHEEQLTIIEHWDSVESHQAAARLIPASQMAEVKPLLGAPPRGRYLQEA